ncbi:MAG: hypothetical protein H6522_12535 [Mycolicibacterium sp.]|nr:hypothetical protein [Mycolicibacterium sp.]
MRTRSKFCGAFGALALAAAAIPLTTMASPAVSRAEDNCDFNYFWNTATNQCQFCDTAVMYWNYEMNQCLAIDPTPYVDPVIGPNSVLGPVGPYGVGGLGPVAGPVGPVGVGGVGPVAGPVGPVGVGRR